MSSKRLKRSDVEHLSSLTVLTVTSVTEDALGIEELLSKYLEIDKDEPLSLFNTSGFLRKGLQRQDATVGYKLLLAYVNESIDCRSKWSNRYNRRESYSYRQMAEVFVSHLRTEYAIKAVSIEKWGELLYSSEPLFSILRRIENIIKDALLPTNEWGIIFAEIDNGFLKLTDYGDFRIHQWESGDGVNFRKRKGLKPARGILR